MNDVELQSLLEEAGYRYMPATGRYVVADAAQEDAEDYATEDVADQLEIPVEDLLRWEQEQQG
jgi:3-polyprenyl-4-hydroxybenzoate decarboxylase